MAWSQKIVTAIFIAIIICYAQGSKIEPKCSAGTLHTVNASPWRQLIVVNPLGMLNDIR